MRLDELRIFLAEDDAGGGGASDSGDTSSGDAATDLADSYHIEDQGEGWSDDVANAPFKLPSSKDESEGDGAEKPAKDEGKDEESAAELDEATLLRAEQAGFSKEAALDLGDKLETVLTAFDRRILANVNQQVEQHKQTQTQQQAVQTPPAQQAKPPEAPIPGDVFETWQAGLAKQLEEQGYEADAAKVLAESMKGLAGHLSQHIASQFTGKLDRLEAAENSRVQRDVENRFEAKVREIDPELFGKERPEKGTPAFEAAAKVWSAMHTLAFGLRQQNLPVPEVEELVARAYRMEFSDKLANQVRSKIKSTLKKQGPVKKPAQRNNAPAGKSPEAKAIGNIAKKLEEKGFGPHMD